MKCPDCGGYLFSSNGEIGETVCITCGTVVDHSEPNYPYVEASPIWISNWSEDDSDTLIQWLTTLRTVSAQLNIPSNPYREEAARVIRKNQAKLLRSQRFGKNKRVSVTALLYLVLREYEVMRPLREMCNALSLDYKMVKGYSWDIQSKVQLKSPFTADKYLVKNAYKLTPDIELIRTAENLLETIRKDLGGNPASLAAGTLYYVCKEKKIKISKEAVGEAFNISARTVYNNAYRINKYLEAQQIR